jgi:hypothetical protein
MRTYLLPLRPRTILLAHGVESKFLESRSACQIGFGAAGKYNIIYLALPACANYIARFAATTVSIALRQGRRRKSSYVVKPLEMGSFCRAILSCQIKDSHRI